MKRIASTLMQLIESCCSDVQVGNLVHCAQHRSNADTVYTRPPGDAHVYFASGSPVRPAGLDTTFNMTVLHNLVKDDVKRTMLHNGIGFHFVSPVEQYVVRSLYAMHGMHGVHDRHRRTAKSL